MGYVFVMIPKWKYFFIHQMCVRRQYLVVLKLDVEVVMLYD